MTRADFQKLADLRIEEAEVLLKAKKYPGASMDQNTLVDRALSDGQALLSNLTRKKFDVVAALWLRPADDSWWQFYIASKAVDEVGPLAAYEFLQQALSARIGIPLNDITLIGASNPIAIDVRRLQRKPTARDLMHVREARLGNLEIEEAYIYPPRAFAESKADPMTPTEVTEKVLALMSDRQNIRPYTIVLLDGASFDGIPFGLELSNRGMTAKFIESGSQFPRVVPVAEIFTIQ